MSIGAGDQAMKPIEFDCKSGCGEKVRYERKTVPGAARKRNKRKVNANLNKPSDTSVPSFAAYLTCANGHTHRYEIPHPDTAE